ncbi:MAG: methylenetetrahydrofolate dehydrogenase / methenyltetrahydrofolate cyclohydrolase [Thermoleophilales bacterium]|jgi:methylenetetrahydrofolate dehydrogenase (NADP+)/methenyltetrahydrofolate cyclohydrolase|nr:methylenetetrahydrofolate dehydrogenase / methenyltetrahydrofolate cyclohydrolase [Thermoleophilales bacterium]
MNDDNIIDGRAVAAEVKERVKRDVAEWIEGGGDQPGLATILVGDDPASQVYVRNKHKATEAAGMRSFHHQLAADTSQDDVAELIQTLNEDDDVHGILLQLPAPPQIDDDAMTALIDPLKDVDGLTPINAGLLVQGKPGMVPATPLGIMELLRAAGAQLEGANAVVVGRSQLVGKPMHSLLLAQNATVTHCHSRTRDLAGECLRADVLVAAVGVPKLIDASMVKEGAIVIDVGINRTDDGLVGDVDFEGVKPKAGAITPVPGGVGQMTIAMLLHNTLKAAKLQAEVRARS